MEVIGIIFMIIIIASIIKAIVVLPGVLIWLFAILTILLIYMVIWAVKAEEWDKQSHTILALIVFALWLGAGMWTLQTYQIIDLTPPKIQRSK